MKMIRMKKLLVFALAAAGAAMAAGAASVRYVDELDLSASYNCRGDKTGVRKSAAGTALSVASRTFGRGIGARAEGAVGFRLDGRATAFDARVGVDDCALKLNRGDRRPKVVFRVWTDGKVAWTSPTLVDGRLPVEAHVDLSGVREIVLETTTDAPWGAFDVAYGDWLDARITCADDAEIAPLGGAETMRQLGVLTPPEKAEPRINGADVWGVRPGKPVVFRVATSGERPMRFTAKGLPDGVTLDAEKGILRGTAPAQKGDYDIEVTAENAKGRATRTIRLAVGDVIALTPPMGWNSWNIWGERFTGEHAREAARGSTPRPGRRRAAAARAATGTSCRTRRSGRRGASTT